MARRPSACAPRPRLGVVPGALYRHVRSKEQLYDLILDAVLAEVDCGPTPRCPGSRRWPCSRTGSTVLENHSGIAALLKTRDPISPASLTLAEAFLAPMHAAGLPGRQAAQAFRLIYDYTLGFALADPASPAERRRHDNAARQQLHSFLCSLPDSRFPTLAAHGIHAWADDREQRLTFGLDTLIAACRPPSADRESGRRDEPVRSGPRALRSGAWRSGSAA